MLQYAYMDESSTHEGSPVISMAGYVFAKEQAYRFTRDWQKDLNRMGLPFAHMTDCATGNRHYANLSLGQRIDSEKVLISHTRHRSAFGIAVAVDYNRYKELFGHGRYDHDAYTLCLGLCVTGIARWATENGYRGRFSFIFEAGHAAEAEANRLMSAMQTSDYGDLYLSHSFADKQEALPLQAADMLAWQFAHYLKRRGQGHTQRRKDFDALLRPIDQLHEFRRNSVDVWRRAMDDLDEDILRKLPEMMPDITEDELAWVAQQMRKKSG